MFLDFQKCKTEEMAALFRKQLIEGKLSTATSAAFVHRFCPLIRAIISSQVKATSNTITFNYLNTVTAPDTHHFLDHLIRRQTHHQLQCSHRFTNHHHHLFRCNDRIHQVTMSSINAVAANNTNGFFLYRIIKLVSLQRFFWIKFGTQIVFNLD